jgi:uncharacterized membrane protein YhaH (DUF805 family)
MQRDYELPSSCRQEQGEDMAIKRPTSVLVISFLLLLSGLPFLLFISLKLIDWQRKGASLNSYDLLTMVQSVMNAFLAITLLRGKDWGRTIFFCALPILFFTNLFVKVSEIPSPDLAPEPFPNANLISTIFESLTPVIFFGISIYFLTRPEENLYFKRSSDLVASACNNKLSDPSRELNHARFWSCLQWYLQTLGKSTSFSGRTSITEFWIFYLINSVLCFIPFLVAVAWIARQSPGAPDVGPLPFLFFLPVILLSPAIAVRRLHDSGKSGWLLLLFLVPVVGVPILMVLLLLPSNQPNLPPVLDSPYTFHGGSSGKLIH